MLATAESCTGGWVAQAITAIAGSSDWFDRGFVTYSNDAKQEMLGVRAETLRGHGAVSEETAREMALGRAARSKATVALAVTGIAGPGAEARRSRSAWCASRGRAGRGQGGDDALLGDRESVRRQSVVHALEGVLKALDGR